MKQINDKINLNEKIAYTIVILGDPNVGKTNLLKRYTKNKFDEKYI